MLAVLVPCPGGFPAWESNLSLNISALPNTVSYHSFIVISCRHRCTVLLCVELQRIADSILYADILVRESMTVLFTNPRQNMWHSQAMRPAQHTRSVRMVFGCSAFSQCIIPWPEFPGMHAIIERLCLGIPKRCIVGNSLTCPSGLWACQRVSHNVLMA